MSLGGENYSGNVSAVDRDIERLIIGGKLLMLAKGESENY
jgi:hypothetical protein